MDLKNMEREKKPFCHNGQNSRNFNTTTTNNNKNK